MISLEQKKRNEKLKKERREANERVKQSYHLGSIKPSLASSKPARVLPLISPRDRDLLAKIICLGREKKAGLDEDNHSIFTEDGT